MSLALGKNSSNLVQPVHLDSTNHLLVNDSTNKAVLETIATNTANINVNVGDVEINVADLEALQQTTINHLDGVIGHINNTNAIGSGQNVLKSMSLGYDRGNDTGVAILVDSLGHIQCDIVSTALPSGGATEAKQDTQETSLDAILAKNTEIETSCNALISANHTDFLLLEASLTSMEAKQDTMIGHNDGVETLLTAIDGVLDNQLTKQGEIDAVLDTSYFSIYSI